MIKTVFVVAHFEVDNIEAIRRISKLCSSDDDFICLGIDGIEDSDFDKLRDLCREETDLF